MDPETDKKDLTDKIQQIINKGVAQQDLRTADLLHGEIDESPVGNKEINPDIDLESQQRPMPKWLAAFTAWRRRNMSDFVFLLWLAFIVGIFAGFASYIFNRLIAITSDIFLSHIQAGRINWWLIFLPIIGIVLAGIYTRYIIHTDLTHGVARLMHSIYRGRYLLKRNLIYSPIIGSSITLGLGGSAGSEGPIAVSGAAIGSNLGRWLQLKMPLVKVLVGCGAAAGISGIFQSPVGGLLFTLEFLKMEIGTLSILAVMLSSLVAYGMVFLCNGCHVPTQFYPEDAIYPEQYWAVLLLGVLCGVYSLYYSMVINRSDTIFINIKNPWLRNISGGLLVGICVMLFPSLYGVGYPVVSDVIHSQFESLAKGDIMPGLHIGEWTLILVAVLILAIKCWACGACNSSGGVSSDFAPTLYAGAIAGFLFAYFSNHILHTNFPIPAFALLGMAAVMAGCIEAPMMSIFIVMNMGTDVAFLLAIIIAVYGSYITVRVLSHIRGYDSKLWRHLNWFRTHENAAFSSAPPATPNSPPSPAS
ncbi:MAG: chloride channel protein [Muribaculaceae bacterium]|nr:chloride channel protein [Muribaculaceae bacterium]